MFDKFTIKRKLFTVGGLLLFTAIISVFLMYEMGKVSEIQKMERDHIEVATLLEIRLDSYFDLVDKGEYEKADTLLNAKSDVHREMGIIALHNKGFAQPLNALKMISPPEEVIFTMLGYGDLFKLIRLDIIAFQKIESNLADLSNKNNLAKNKPIVIAATDEIIGYSTGFAPRIRSAAEMVKNLMDGVSILFLSLTIILLFFTSRSILNTINRLSLATKNLSKGNGDLTQRLNITAKDEIGVAAQNIDDFIDVVQNILLKIKTGADQIKNNGDYINQLSEQISQGASEQASNAEEISSSIEQMAANINQNSENAQQTERIAMQVSNDIAIVNESFIQTVKAMNEIVERIMIINEIANKTDLLAVNAAIEAARAGEFGKGFAVVANEIRKLSERSQKAAKEISEISVKSVKKAEDSGQLLHDIIPSIQNTAKLVQEITAASMEQDTGVDQINKAIQQLTTVTQQNAISAEEMASGSEKFVNEAESLLETISFFTLGASDVDKKIDNLSNQIENLLMTVNEMKQSKEKKVSETHSKLNFQHNDVPKKGVNLKMADKLDDDFQNS